MPKGDEDLRLLVDRVLSKLYRSGEIEEIYARWCREPEESTLSFFRMNSVPD